MIKDKKSSELIGFEIFDKIASFTLTNKYRYELNSNLFQLSIKTPYTLTAPGLNFWENGGLIWKFCSSGVSLALGLDILNFIQGPRSVPALIIQKLGSEEERKVKIQNHSFIKNLKKKYLNPLILSKWFSQKWPFSTN